MRHVLILLALVCVANAASAQTRSVVVTNTGDGFVLSEVTDTPILDESAILLTAPADGSSGWAMLALSPGDSPADELARVVERNAHPQMALDLHREGADRHGVVARYHRERMERQRSAVDLTDDGDLMEEVEFQVGDARPTLHRIRVARAAAPSVRFEIQAQIEQALDVSDPLVATLADDAALGSLDVRVVGDQAHLGIVFEFDGVDDWRAWMDANAETLGLLRERAEEDTLGLKLDIR